MFRVRAASLSDQNKDRALLKLSEGEWRHVVISYRVEKGDRRKSKHDGRKD